jgi:hypothetical protein
MQWYWQTACIALHVRVRAQPNMISFHHRPNLLSRLTRNIPPPFLDMRKRSPRKPPLVGRLHPLRSGKRGRDDLDSLHGGEGEGGGCTGFGIRGEGGSAEELGA